VRYFGSKSGRNAHKTATFAGGSGLVTEPSQRLIYSAEITMSSMREYVLERPSYVARLSPSTPNSRAEGSPTITDDPYMLVRSVGRT